MSLFPNCGVAITEDVVPVSGLSPDATSIVGCDGLGIEGMHRLSVEERWGLGVDAWTCEEIGI
ncbi:haloacid dehalogenase [Sesbania bispinosa]|nr:haloacid dehalogenase [Sesbania bispinosa]